MDNKNPDEQRPSEISADVVTVEVKDKATGEVFRRELPIDYLENAFCLRLKGEDMQGRSTELVFYSDAGARSLRNLTGGGADKDRPAIILEACSACEARAFKHIAPFPLL